MKYSRATILGVVAIAAAAACGGGTDGTGVVPEPITRAPVPFTAASSRV